MYDTGGSDGQAYAVLTLCRALYTATSGEQVSKRRAALWASERLPNWSTLIVWALARHDEEGTRSPSQDRFEEVVRFVEEVSARVEGEFESNRTQQS
ncbi:aminoglycoside adenylyltransferase domain-containing protein [Deinococcus yavapaiensis]|uniref:Uncharacterized protein DUF4111 n=1 Tax=Deinococcus yavapaiensis KR-236 TaxID=694435 RepID=A0A318S5W0_9DEIO|nr:aminoglycoside adenylyltransferase domain-containing protein [Deinococcus yavapaiensis]PYE54172.1 uncharacterized protein DUF4111 [Deinococcus yavapaiensis KR-236]